MLLSEQTLSRELEIGRTPIREALQRLSYEGLVHILPHRGVLVSEIDLMRQFRMIELRRVVESMVVRAACRRGMDAQFGELAEIAEGLEEAAASEDVVKFIRLDQEMDRVLYDMAQNEFATKALRLMSSLTRRFWYLQHTRRGGVSRCARLHSEIARAVAVRDDDTAVVATNRLLDYIEALSHENLDSSHGAKR
jgi:DNA-binding GntR family transcriptional regulator